MPSCHECSISPERRKVTVGSPTLFGESVQDGQRNYPVPFHNNQTMTCKTNRGHSKITSHVDDSCDGTKVCINID